MKLKKDDSGIERILWSIAFPGFGQILNRKLVKGILFIGLEFIINVKSNLNEAIILSFQGETAKAASRVDYQWLMFYPCIYVFAIWDAYIDSKAQIVPYGFLPFIVPAYLGTTGVVYSSSFKINGCLLGPIWLPIISMILGASVGILIRILIRKYLAIKNKNSVV